MSDENITVSEIGKPAETWSYSRRQFYDEQFTDDANSNLAVHIVAIFILTSNGELLLQKRAINKRHNSRLIDKTLGGHISFGDSADYTVMVESIQELLTPSIVLNSEDNFKKTYDLLKDYLNTVALIKHHETKEFRFTKIVESQSYQVSNVIHMYFGFYDGSTKPADKEAAGMLYYSMDELDKEVKANPKQFTDDLKKLLAVYKDDLQEFIHTYLR
jgi:isopentenyldiphosphate isomerase